MSEMNFENLLRQSSRLKMCCSWVAVVENALVLACARRLLRSADSPPSGVILSLACFGPLIDEVLGLGAPRPATRRDPRARPAGMIMGLRVVSV